METCDVLIVGAGMAGAAAGYELAALGAVIVLEMEAQPGYHSTGRSAATFTKTYGNAAIRALAAAAQPFLEAPPRGFADHDLLRRRPILTIANATQGARMDAALAAAEAAGAFAQVEEIAPARALELLPALRPEAVARAALEADSADIEVHGLHQGFLKGLRARGGKLVTGAGVEALSRADGRWRAATRRGDFAAPVVVDAAGAWAERIGALAGAGPIGLVPFRRTAMLFDPPPQAGDISAWPVLLDVAEQFYFKPDAGQVLASPADETPSPPCDAQPEALDVALAVERIERVSTLTVRRVNHRWAGLRSFVADRTPVVGPAPGRDGFFWLAGQGGYGIKCAPPLARILAARIDGRAMPDDIAALGLSFEAVAADRPGLTAA